jgi:hypothetical protein
MRIAMNIGHSRVFQGSRKLGGRLFDPDDVNICGRLGNLLGKKAQAASHLQDVHALLNGEKSNECRVRQAVQYPKTRLLLWLGSMDVGRFAHATYKIRLSSLRSRFFRCACFGGWTETHVTRGLPACYHPRLHP